LRNTAPEKPVRIGVRNVNTVASDNDKYCKEKYTPETPKNLGKGLGAFAILRTYF
jgi:hypothetical protein